MLTFANAKELAQQVKDNVEAYSKLHYAQEPREHLGISVIGEKCSRKIWLNWRWCGFEDFDGRMLRLFNRGHNQEPRFIEWLTGVGFTIHETNPETGKQWKLSYHGNHYGGSCDSQAFCPQSWNYTRPIGCEYKSHSDKKFKELVKGGVREAYPKYYRQIQSYGNPRGFNWEWCLYCGINKNDDDIYFEWIKIEQRQGDADYLRAEQIILSQTPAPMIAQNRAFFDCKYCNHQPICYDNKAPLKNCRSCVRARPVENASWVCGQHNLIIPENILKVGCEHYSRII